MHRPTLASGSGAEESIGGQRNMSNNYRFYASKMEELRARREIDRPCSDRSTSSFCS